MRNSTKTLTTKTRTETSGMVGRDAVLQEDSAHEPFGQRRRSEKGRFCLQVDRQTKSSYPTYEAAEQAALIIKRGHPIVRVAIYDTIEGVNKVIELPHEVADKT
jgi:hypothetical protein